MSKKVQGNISSLFDLKAELLKKKDSLKEHSNLSGVNRAALYVKGKPVLAEKRRAIREAKEAQKNAKTASVVSDVEQQELQRQLAKSRQALEAKAALYDSLRSGKQKDLDDENKPIYLVNFSEKAGDAIDEVSSEDEGDGPGKAATNIPSAASSPSGSDDLVEYTDYLGRTRTCHKSDLQSMLLADKDLSTRTPMAKWNENTELLSEDMRRELRRQEWEKETEAAAEVGPIHYQHVMSNEPRTLGTAYYHFSLDESTRQEQLKQLKKASEQTKAQRERNARLRERRKKLMDERLRKVMERKNITVTMWADADGGADVSSIPLPDDKPDERLEEKKEVVIPEKKRIVSTHPSDQESMKEATYRYMEKQRSVRNAEIAERLVSQRLNVL
uniref:Coiled-coil domain-containing protein 174 n=1 Tax=Trichuris muris TaxID=70415 RepID=A0A5S6QEZ1_TRIMR